MKRTRVMPKSWWGDAETPRVYVGRPTMWGNPFRIGQAGTREQVIAKYKRWFWAKVNSDAEFRDWTRTLAGAGLVCNCHPLPCHADVIAAWLNAGAPVRDED